MRKDIVLATVYAAAWTVAGGGVEAGTEDQRVKRPNIILILADDMGYGDFGMFNPDVDPTPHLDALAGEGFLLTEHYTASPICAPARAALLTGRYPHRTGVVDVRESRPLSNLALREVTLADVLKPNGYATGLIGKWHNGSIGVAYHPNRRGFDEFFGFRGGGQDYWEWTVERNGEPVPRDGRYLTDVFTEEALSFIDRHREKPFFLHLAYTAPHAPFQAPEEDIARFRREGVFTEEVATLYAMIDRMDAGIGLLLDRLKEYGLDENTLILFASDNGPVQEYPLTRFNLDLKGGKKDVYEGGIRVPMILHWPAGLPAGRRHHGMVHFCDWFPTLLAAAGIEPDQEIKLDGINQLGALRGEMPGSDAKRFWQFTHYQPLLEFNAAMRDGEWKLVRPHAGPTRRPLREDSLMDSAMRNDPFNPDRQPHLDPPAPIVIPPPAPPLLFNLDQDPCEISDLSAAHPERIRQMLGELENWFEEVEADRATIQDEVYLRGYWPVYEIRD